MLWKYRNLTTSSSFQMFSIPSIFLPSGTGYTGTYRQRRKITNRKDTDLRHKISVWEQTWKCEILNSHSGSYEYYCRLVRDVIYSGTHAPTFRRNVLPTYSRKKPTWRLRRKSPERQCMSTKRQVVTSQKTIFLHMEMFPFTTKKGG